MCPPPLAPVTLLRSGSRRCGDAALQGVAAVESNNGCTAACGHTAVSAASSSSSRVSDKYTDGKGGGGERKERGRERRGKEKREGSGRDKSSIL